MLKRFFLFFIVGIALLIGIYLTVVFKWSYSSGERAGWVQKFSSKGWVCKTWEGEIAMVTLPGSVPEKFPFTVRDEAVAAQITHSVGQRVTLHYEQHRGLPGTCFGDTEYWVDAVTLAPMQPFGPASGIQPELPPPAATVPPPAPAVPSGAAPAGTAAAPAPMAPSAPAAPAPPQPAH